MMKEREEIFEKEKEEWQEKKEEERKEMRKEVQKEKDEWADHQEQVRKINAIADEIIDLNVGGNTKDFTVTKSLFRTFPGTYLDSLVSGNFPLQLKNDRIFINRDPKIFRMIIQYLRTGIHPIDLDKKTQTYYEHELVFLGL